MSDILFSFLAFYTYSLPCGPAERLDEPVIRAFVTAATCFSIYVVRKLFPPENVLPSFWSYGVHASMAAW